MKNTNEKTLRTYIGLLILFAVWLLLIGCSSESETYNCKCYDTIYRYSELLGTDVPVEVGEIYTNTCGGDELSNSTTLTPNGKVVVTCN